MGKRNQDQSITVGDISNSTGVAIGSNARARVDQQPSVNAAEVITLLEELARSVDVYADSLDDAAEVQESLQAAQKEAARKIPRWERIREDLNHVGTAVAGIATLAQAVNNIWALVSR